ncbi:ALIX V-shaped domain binding to HIV-domain-containing protein [Dunaliella salina]|nr:ALIX V-shaped domain binding to HIV-domain-containing protein [Dunaliella salina]|eukprot:KAF5836068.1 ALIX V-shaped domain binding to HIV-domain-containing protein [Dunaliella salina]
MYEGVTRGFGLSSLSSYFDKSWPAHAALKGSVFQVEVLSQTAKALQAEDNIAHQVSVLREAFAVLQNTKKLAKAVGADMVDSVNKLQDGVVAALGRAEKDNNTIYLQRVPAFGDTGINVQGALLVKNYPPTNLDASTDNLFSSLVPDSSAKSLSKYTDAVDGVTRDARDRLAAATDTARTRLKEMELPEMLEALDPRSSKGTASALPSALLADLEEIQSIGGVMHIQGILAEIGELKRTCEEELVAAANALNADAQADAEARAKYGDQFRATPAPTAAKSYWDRIAQFRASLAQAAASDEGVMDQLAQHQEGFACLAVDAAALKLPRLQAPMVTTGDEDPAIVVASLRRDLEALQALASERSGIEEALNDLKSKDNILPKIMSVNQQAHDSLFASELKKYDVLVADIKRNSEAQTELLARIGNQNKGLRFYLGMHEVERRCRQEAEDFTFTRSVQRDELKQDIERSKRVAEEAEQLTRRMVILSMKSQHRRAITPSPLTCT